MAINRALIRFKEGHISKKEAHHTMTQVLGDNYELSHDLFDILICHVKAVTVYVM